MSPIYNQSPLIITIKKNQPESLLLIFNHIYKNNGQQKIKIINQKLIKYAEENNDNSMLLFLHTYTDNKLFI